MALSEIETIFFKAKITMNDPVRIAIHLKK
jgi:hypothetical protein